MTLRDAWPLRLRLLRRTPGRGRPNSWESAGDQVILPGLFGTLCFDPNGMLMVCPAEVHVPVPFTCAAREAPLRERVHAAAL